MSQKSRIQAFILILIYGMLLIHDLVPHSHDHQRDFDLSHHSYHEQDDPQNLGLFDFLKNLLHSHSELNDAQHHELSYKNASVEYPFCDFIMYLSAPLRPALDFPGSKKRNINTLSYHHWHNVFIQFPNCLRAPPMS